MDAAHKAKLLFSLLRDRPLEVYDRCMMQIADMRSSGRLRHLGSAPDAGLSWDEFLEGVAAAIGCPLKQYAHEDGLAEITDQVRDRISQELEAPPFTLRYNGGRRLAAFCYIICRALRPESVLETGVAYGVTSAYILKALSLNGRGVLHSIDLPPLSAASRNNQHFVGILVPEGLRDRWKLYRGLSKRILPSLLPRIAPIAVACLDSRSTYEVKLAEMRQIGTQLGNPGVMIAGDVTNPAFKDWSDISNAAFCATTVEIDRDNPIGAAVITQAAAVNH